MYKDAYCSIVCNCKNWNQPKYPPTGDCLINYNISVLENTMQPLKGMQWKHTYMYSHGRVRNGTKAEHRKMEIVILFLYDEKVYL